MRNFNQEQYLESAEQYEKIKLDSTMYLAYRDLELILKKHLPKKGKIRLLDYGCGPGTSTEIVINFLKKLGFKVEAHGVDINSKSLALAQERLPDVNFHLVELGKALPEYLTNFDLIICNFVLIELRSDEMLHITENIHAALNSNGVALITNTTAKTYHSDKKWYSLNNDFSENAFPDASKKLSKDQEVKLELTDKSTGSKFVVSDFFHSGSSYRDAYLKSGLYLADTLKPRADKNDEVKWGEKAPEFEFPPYKIHVLYKADQIFNSPHHCISGDGNVLGILNDNYLTLINLTSKQRNIIAVPFPPNIKHFTMDKHGKNIVIFSYSCLVLINAELRKSVYLTDDSGLAGGTISPDGSHLSYSLNIENESQPYRMDDELDFLFNEVAVDLDSLSQEANKKTHFLNLEGIREYKKMAWSDDNQFYAATERDSQIKLMSLSDREIDLDSGALIPSYNSEPIIALKLNGIADENGHYLCSLSKSEFHLYRISPGTDESNIQEVAEICAIFIKEVENLEKTTKHEHEFFGDSFVDFTIDHSNPENIGIVLLDNKNNLYWMNPENGEPVISKIDKSDQILMSDSGHIIVFHENQIKRGRMSKDGFSYEEDKSLKVDQSRNAQLNSQSFFPIRSEFDKNVAPSDLKKFENSNNDEFQNRT